jgi:hypothetical protein
LLSSPFIASQAALHKSSAGACASMEFDVPFDCFAHGQFPSAYGESRWDPPVDAPLPSRTQKSEEIVCAAFFALLEFGGSAPPPILENYITVVVHVTETLVHRAAVVDGEAVLFQPVVLGFGKSVVEKDRI